jgi:hypothetical protein
MEPEGTRSGAASAEGIEGPFIVFLTMAKDVNISVVSMHFETMVANAVPLVENLHHIEPPGAFLARLKTLRTFISLVARVAFNVQDHRHRVPPLNGQFAAYRVCVFVGKSNRLH